MTIITCTYTVKYSEVDCRGNVTPVSFLDFLQEAAFHHMDAANNKSAATERSGIWMVYKWYVEPRKYPCWKDEITVETWISQIRSREVAREFEVYSKDRELLATATSLVLLVDKVKGTPKRIDEDERMRLNPENRKATSHEFTNIKTDGIELQTKAILPATYCDIDTNNHVNNTRYLRMFLDNIPPEIHINYHLKRLEIIYRHQVRLGETITVMIGEYHNRPDTRTFIGQLENNEKTSVLLQAEFVRIT